MKNLFFIGGAFFMSILTLELILITAWSVYQGVGLFLKREAVQGLKMRIQAIPSMGLFALISGILGQLIGLYEAFSAIERAADISPAIVVGGLKVSMITTLYGFLIFLFALILYFILQWACSRRIS